KNMNKQILFSDFDDLDFKFDAIFMNDVFEHLTFPKETLTFLTEKLKKDGFIFIDTPCEFWLYPLTKFLSPKIHKKLLKGTVDFDHQQIWTTKSFFKVASEASLQVIKYKRLSEYTQKASFYLDNMKINNKFLRLCGKLFYLLSPFLAKNKIMSVIKLQK
ncbi:class I SAM-dependent methyltransferase, partial [Verrucomicrobiales bacterium]|nr:class I SAM-dependent methyltransferase [Verrucomicrobiales bacterium]